MHDARNQNSGNAHSYHESYMHTEKKKTMPKFWKWTHSYHECHIHTEKKKQIPTSNIYVTNAKYTSKKKTNARCDNSQNPQKRVCKYPNAMLVIRWNWTKTNKCTMPEIRILEMHIHTTNPTCTPKKKRRCQNSGNEHIHTMNATYTPKKKNKSPPQTFT